eukprot:CAMPEP_0202049100 /NCGR_PEP_ID=MMETSP0963-20130614/3157_1 /ASSEMBLY_ACC=CAM_ASM_000494 /TAXON_ID=4773 /ORGANISM="Schizochytrium aggregatum, Strain ATCC28209" /LENGTH=285 /DNA_ID=CAMNT_0048614081 /DNA_START=121 /DNA_END=974 /DNA_ORIENTATION=+
MQSRVGGREVEGERAAAPAAAALAASSKPLEGRDPRHDRRPRARLQVRGAVAVRGVDRLVHHDAHRGVVARLEPRLAAIGRHELAGPADGDGHDLGARALRDEERPALERLHVLVVRARPLREDEDAHAVAQLLHARVHHRAAALLVLALDPDVANEPHAPSRHGYVEDLLLGDEADGEREPQQRVDVGPRLVVGHEDDGLVPERGDMVQAHELRREERVAGELGPGALDGVQEDALVPVEQVHERHRRQQHGGEREAEVPGPREEEMGARDLRGMAHGAVVARG